MKYIALLFAFMCIFRSALSAQEEVSLSTPTGTLFGTLQTPVIKTAVPVVMIISGSGPTDRDGNNVKMKNNSLKMLADSLQNHGIASLRYDKRGVASSMDAATAEEDLRFETYVEDAVAWINMLKSDKRFSKVIVAGHSEGSLIGMIASKQAGPAGFISIAGAGRSADIVLKEQLSGQPESIKTACYQTIDSLVAGKPVKEVNPMLYSLFRPSVQPYMISWLKYDPQKEIAKLSIPILIVQGTTDIQVTEEDANLLKQSAPAGRLFMIQGMNHILKDASSDRQENISTYTDPNLPLNQSLVGGILDFLNQFR